jgi:very-short-patch-repair endonuclease
MLRFTPGDLRRYPTVSEQILWNHLRARQMVGLKFRRQHPIGPFIVDFVCLSRKIVIEVDGVVHEQQRAYDKKRDDWLQSQGFTVIRITNDELQRDWRMVIARLRGVLMRRIWF